MLYGIGVVEGLATAFGWFIFFAVLTCIISLICAVACRVDHRSASEVAAGAPMFEELQMQGQLHQEAS